MQGNAKEQEDGDYADATAGTKGKGQNELEQIKDKGLEGKVLESGGKLKGFLHNKLLLLQ